MLEYRILVRLNKTRFRKGQDKKLYGNCQACKDKYGLYCIEASTNSMKKNIVFLFCKDCYAVLNDICCVFIFKKKTYLYEDGYPISENPIQQKWNWHSNRYYLDPIWKNI